jgi:hypothetical protein
MKLIPYLAPKRYTFIDPDTQVHFEESSREILVQRILAYRKQNRLEPIDNLTTVLENYWCGLPENLGACEPNAYLRRGVMQYVQGGVTLLANMLFKRIVPQAVADARSNICAQCPHNVLLNKSWFVKQADEIALHSTNGLKSINHDKLGNCAICTCPLRAKVFYGDTINLPQDQYARLPDYCWQKIAMDQDKKKV